MKRFHCRTFCLLVTALLALPMSDARAQQPRATAQAPENHVELKDTVSGSYMIARPLKQDYERLLNRLRALKSDIESERTSGAEALRDVRKLQSDLQRLRKEIEDKKVFVPVAKTHVQTETMTFDLGAERCLVITADTARVVGWNQPGVKCELEKTILSADGKQDDEEMKSLKLVHRQGVATEIVGKTAAESEAEEQQFLASPAGQALSPQQRKARQELVAGIAARWTPYRDFQGKEIDTLHIEGLTGQEGNQQMTLALSSKEGGQSQRSVWRRHARLTVYVPTCKALAIRGGLASLDIQDVRSPLLLLTADGSHDRDYHGESHVRGLQGSLVVRHIPLQGIEDVSGDVSILSTGELANSGTTHDGGSEPGQELRTMHHYRALPCSCKNIGGNLQGWLARVDLLLENIAGRIDVRNEFGDTKLIATRPLASTTHRVVTESGRIELSLTPSALGELPLWAATLCGSVRTNASRDLLTDFRYSQGQDADGVRRSWSGFRRPRAPQEPFDPTDFMASVARADQALRGQDRSPGLDLISRGGSVVVQVKM